MKINLLTLEASEHGPVEENVPKPIGKPHSEDPETTQKVAQDGAKIARKEPNLKNCHRTTFKQKVFKKLYFHRRL